MHIECGLHEMDAKIRLLLLSNSRSADGTFLGWAGAQIRAFLGTRVASVLFVPYAAVPGTQVAYDAYAGRARGAFSELGYELCSIHEAVDAAQAARSAAAIVVGGGNTFHLLTRLYSAGLEQLIGERVREGVPYIGWSAGAVVAAPSIATTNDMPIIAPPSFRALGLVQFQINVHYTDAHAPGHQGETRAERIDEFLRLQPAMTVVGLRECSLLHVQGRVVRLSGAGARVFRADRAPVEWSAPEQMRLDALSGELIGAGPLQLRAQQ